MEIVLGAAWVLALYGAGGILTVLGFFLLTLPEWWNRGPRRPGEWGEIFLAWAKVFLLWPFMLIIGGLFLVLMLGNRRQYRSRPVENPREGERDPH